MDEPIEVPEPEPWPEQDEIQAWHTIMKRLDEGYELVPELADSFWLIGCITDEQREEAKILHERKKYE